jgi:hypothetical protein
MPVETVEPNLEGTVPVFLNIVDDCDDVHGPSSNT